MNLPIDGVLRRPRYTVVYITEVGYQQLKFTFLRNMLKGIILESTILLHVENDFL